MVLAKLEKEREETDLAKCTVEEGCIRAHINSGKAALQHDTSRQTCSQPQHMDNASLPRRPLYKHWDNKCH